LGQTRLILPKTLSQLADMENISEITNAEYQQTNIGYACVDDDEIPLGVLYPHAKNLSTRNNHSCIESTALPHAQTRPPPYSSLPPPYSR
jgi:hypothetical protein